MYTHTYVCIYIYTYILTRRSLTFPQRRILASSRLWWSSSTTCWSWHSSARWWSSGTTSSRWIYTYIYVYIYVLTLLATQNFGIFTALVIFLDYVLVMTFFCSVVVIWHDKFEMKPGLCCACCADFGGKCCKGGCDLLCTFSGLETSTALAQRSSPKVFFYWPVYIVKN